MELLDCNYIHKTLWQSDVCHSERALEQWRDFAVLESRDAASDSCYEECEFGVLFGKFDELIDVGFDDVNAAVHRRDGVRLSLQADALSEDCAELFFGYPCSPAVMVSVKIAAKNKNLIFSKF